jgi:purine-nucleoside phosphorylase
MANGPRSAKSKPRKVNILPKPGSGIAMETAGTWTKRAGFFEREAAALLRASEQCLYMAEAIRRARRKAIPEGEEENLPAIPRMIRRAAG